MENATLRKRILFLAANPKNTIPLRLDEEVREIDAGLRRASNRDNFDLLQKWAIRPRDLRQAMLDVKPNIVHFSGHGSSCGGLFLEDAMGEPKLIEPMALAGLFSLFSHDLECVLLNACYSEVQAEAINDHIKYVIGMNDAIGDRAAIEFAVGFYDALGNGQSVETAYRFGCNAIQLEGLSNNLIPVLKSAPSASLPRNLESGAPKKWILVLSATIDEVDKDKAEAIIEHLRQLSQDTSLTIRAIKPGSVKLVIESSVEGFDKINTLIREKKLTQIAGLRIQEIREHEAQSAVDFPSTLQVARPNPLLSVGGSLPRVFIGSSRESLNISYALQDNLEHEAEITVWTQGIFEPTKAGLESLIKRLEDFDFGIFTCSTDDLVKLREKKTQTPRDNVVFELGLLVGRLGSERNFIVIPSGHETLHLPTDLLGITPVTFNPHREDSNLNAALGPACKEITKAIRKHGISNKARRVPSEVHPSLRTPTSLLNELVNGALQTVCRAVSLPQSPEAVRIRAFVFEKRDAQLVCSHYWAPNPAKEMVGKLKFDITPEVAKRVAVVRAVISEQVTRTKISPLPGALERSSGEVAEDLSFVLAVPIFNDDSSVWGVVDFDALSPEAEMILSTKVSDAIMFQLAQHLKIILSLDK